MKKHRSDTAFIPRRWQTVLRKIQPDYSEGDVVTPGKGGIYVRLFREVDYIHCIGSDNPKTLNKIIWNVAALSRDEETRPSRHVRYCLAQNLAQYFSLDFHQIKIKRTRANGELLPPCVYVEGRKTDIDISLSHDGRFVAYAFSESLTKKVLFFNEILM